jgi:hypothetical protein
VILLTVSSSFSWWIFPGGVFHHQQIKPEPGAEYLRTAGCIPYPESASQLNQLQEVAKIRTAAYQQIVPLLKDPPKIISASYYGCSAREYALTYGLHESGRYGSFLFEEMKKLYPETYMYFPWGKVFYEGNKETEPASFLKPYTVYSLYIADYSDERLDEITRALNANGKNIYCTAKEIYYSQATKALAVQTELVTMKKCKRVNRNLPRLTNT